MEYISSPKNDRIKTAKKLTVKKHQKGCWAILAGRTAFGSRGAGEWADAL